MEQSAMTGAREKFGAFIRYRAGGQGDRLAGGGEDDRGEPDLPFEGGARSVPAAGRGQGEEDRRDPRPRRRSATGTGRPRVVRPLGYHQGAAARDGRAAADDQGPDSRRPRAASS